MTITAEVPFFLIAPDARGGSMGETGVASEHDVNSMHWNPAKFAFLDKGFGIAASSLSALVTTTKVLIKVTVSS